MHLFLLNVIPNLVDHWTGNFKNLDAGTGTFEIAPQIWAEIGEETAAAVQNIPAAFVRVLSNIAEDQSLFTAEAWAFWFMYIASIVMFRQFKDVKYYHHMCGLVEIMKITLQFSITCEEIDILENKIIEWVKLYEE